MKKFLLFLQMVPAIIETVLAVERTINGPGKGPEKLTVVLETVKAATETVPEIQKSFEAGELEAGVTGIVNGAVKAMNAAGVMTPKTP